MSNTTTSPIVLSIAFLAASACLSAEVDSSSSTTLATTLTSDRPEYTESDSASANPPDSSTTTSSTPSEALTDEQLIDAFTPTTHDLDAVRLSDEVNGFVYETWQTAMRDCMRDRGFDDFVTIDYSATAGARIAIRTPVTPSEVDEYGYHQPPRYDTPDPYGPNEQRADAEPEYFAALIGDTEDTYPRSGCRDQMFELVYDESGEFRRLDQQLGNEAIQIVIAFGDSDRLADINEQWSECMSRAGYDYTDPSRPGSRFAGEAEVSSEEIATRRADIACQLELSYVATTTGWVAEEINAWVADNPETIDRYATLKLEYLDRITQLRDELDAS